MIVIPGGALLLGYTDLRRGGIWVAASADGGASFQRALVDPAMGNFVGLCPDGRPGGAYLTYFVNRTIRLAHTNDGGLTWSAPVNAAVSDPTGDIACQDPMCVADGDDVYVSYSRTHDSADTPVQRLVAVHVAHLTWGASVLNGDVVALTSPAAPADGGGPVSDGGEAQGFLLFPQLGRRADGALGLAAYRAAGDGAGLADLVAMVSPGRSEPRSRSRPASPRACSATCPTGWATTSAGPQSQPALAPRSWTTGAAFRTSCWRRCASRAWPAPARAGRAPWRPAQRWPGIRGSPWPARDRWSTPRRGRRRPRTPPHCTGA